MDKKVYQRPYSYKELCDAIKKHGNMVVCKDGVTTISWFDKKIISLSMYISSYTYTDFMQKCVWLDDDTSCGILVENYSIYRPYMSAEEFLADQKIHGPKISYDRYGYNSVTQVEEHGMWINPYKNHMYISYNDLIKYKWEDGHPLGKINKS